MPSKSTLEEDSTEYQGREYHIESVSNNQIHSSQAIDQDKVDETQSSSSSSPFITNPDVPRSEEGFASLNITNKNILDEHKHTIKSEHIGEDQFELKMSHLQESLNKIQLDEQRNDRFSKEVISDFRDRESSLINTSGHNMSASFDDDFDIDEGEVGEMSTQQNASPWRLLRSSSAQGSSSSNLRIDHRNKNSFMSKIPILPYATTDSESTHKIKELERQVTGFKIQIKIFKQFLQSIIDRSLLDKSAVLDVGELENFQTSFNGLLANAPESSNLSEYGNLNMSSKERLSEDYDELLKINDDLYANLEKFRFDLEEKELKLDEINYSLQEFSAVIKHVLEVLLSYSSIEESSRIEISRLIHQSIDKNQVNIDLLHKSLHIVLREVRKIIRNSQSKKTVERYPSPPSSTSGNDFEIASCVKSIKSAIDSLNELKSQYTSQKDQVSLMALELKKELENNRIGKSQSEELNQKFESLSDAIQEIISSNFNNAGNGFNGSNKDSDEQRNMTQRYDELQKEASTQRLVIEDYKNKNKILEEEIERVKVSSVPDSSSFSSDSRGTHYTSLQDKVNDLSQSYRKLEQESSKTISSLSGQLRRKIEENIRLNAQLRDKDLAETELNLAMEKQRILKAEKTRLKYDLDLLLKEKESMQGTIKSLMERVNFVGTQKVVEPIENINTRKNIEDTLETKLNEILSFDLQISEKYLKSFVKIADDYSLKVPKKNIEKLVKLNSICSNSEDECEVWDLKKFSTIQECHKRVFEYFARAVDIIVNDHVKLLLRESDSKSEQDQYIITLKDRIEELNKLNDDLSKSLDLLESRDPKSNAPQVGEHSPRSKLRIEELMNRWKAERESRVYENKEAQKRIRELSMENSRLREEIEKVV